MGFEPTNRGFADPLDDPLDPLRVLYASERGSSHLSVGLPLSAARTAVRPGDLIVVTWVDSKTYEGWQHYHGAELAECRSVGWVLETDDTRVALGQSREDVDDETLVNGVIAIPWSCAVKTEILRAA